MRHRPVMGEPLFLLCVKVGESEVAATALRAELEAVRIELATVHAGANVRAAPPRRTVTMRSATGRPCKPSLAGTTAHRTQAELHFAVRLEYQTPLCLACLLCMVQPWGVACHACCLSLPMCTPTVRRSLAPPLRDATLLQPEQLQEKIAALERQLADAKSAGARADEKLRLSAASAEKRDLAAAMRAAEDAKRIETLEREVAATAQKADSLSRSLRKAREEAAGGRSDGGIAAAADLEAQLESVSAALEAERLEAKRAKRAAAEEIAELQRMLEVRREEHARASERDRCPVHGQTCHLPPPTSPVLAEPALFSWRAPLAASQWRWRGRVRRDASGCAAPMRTSWYSCSSSWPRHRPVRTRASRRFRSGLGCSGSV